MSQITVGEDILVILIAVGLISVFILVLMDSVSANNKQEKTGEKFQLLLTISDYAKNGEISKSSRRAEIGVLSKDALQKDLPQLVEKLKREGVEFNVKVTNLDHEALFKLSDEEKGFSQSVSLPIVYECKNGRIPGFLIIGMGE